MPAIDSNVNSKKEVAKTVENILQYVKEHSEELALHYLSVKTETGSDYKPSEKKYTCTKISENEYLSKLLKVSIVILTANAFESEILNLNLSNRFGCTVLERNPSLLLLRGKKPTYAYIFEMPDYTILHLHAPDTGSNTPCGSADLARYINECEYLNPSCIISFGICFGQTMDGFNLGDTIVAEKIYPWSIGVKISLDNLGNTTWEIKSDDYVINLAEFAPLIYDKIKTTCNSTTNLCLNQQVLLGNIITSEAVVSNELVKRSAEIAAHGWKIIGGEMEGYGLAKEALFYGPQDRNRPRIACVILKAICDWGAVKNIDDYIDKATLCSLLTIQASYKDQIQAYTAYCAYKVLEALLEEKVFDNNNILSSFTKYINNLFMRNNGFMSVDRFHQFISEWLANSQGDHQASDLRFPVEKYNRLSQERLNNYIRMLSSLVLENTNEFYVDNNNMIYRHPIQK